VSEAPTAVAGRRRCRAVLVVASVCVLAPLCLPAAASAAAATYTVVQCAPLNRAADDVAVSGGRAYYARNACGVSGTNAVRIDSISRAPYGAAGKARWSTGTQWLGIVAVDVSAKLRRHDGHTSKLWIADGRQRQVAGVASGKSRPAGYRHRRWRTRGPGQRQFVASLTCGRRHGCRRSDLAHTWLRNLRLEVADYARPVLAASGSLLAGGWKRGTQDLATGGSDAGSGLRRIAGTVDGTGLVGRTARCAVIPGSPFAKTFEPCPAALPTSFLPVNTAAPPLHDGRDHVSVCALDFAGNRTCQERTVAIDNTAPTLAFANAQERNDPELIKALAKDATSGVARGRIYYRAVGSSAWEPLLTDVKRGALEARVDSTAPPPGQYEFLAQASDVAGNSTRTTMRQDGQPMVLTFPLKSGVRLTGHLAGGGGHRKTIAYGRRSRVGGRLTDRGGHPIGGQEVTVVEHFGSGALIARRVRTVRTDRRGRWRERLPAGPSRQISASYAGSPRYIPAEAAVGRLLVKTKVGLRLSRHRVRAGRRVTFRGRVRHFAARVPDAGKLVELQVKTGHSWTTVRHAFHTRANGGFRLHYRFGRFYTRRVRFRFRLEVPREPAWPYKLPARSKTRKLLVKPR
jgi:hypothetical protein